MGNSSNPGRLLMRSYTRYLRRILCLPTRKPQKLEGVYVHVPAPYGTVVCTLPELGWDAKQTSQLSFTFRGDMSLTIFLPNGYRILRKLSEGRCSYFIMPSSILQPGLPSGLMLDLDTLTQWSWPTWSMKSSQASNSIGLQNLSWATREKTKQSSING